MNNIKELQLLASEFTGDNTFLEEEDIKVLLYNIRSSRARLSNKVDNLKYKNKELTALFDVQRTRVGEADKLWQEATGKHNTIPDLGELIDWLAKHL